MTPAVAAAQRLRIDYATARVLEAFEQGGVPSILLKGPTIARWLYAPGETRTYADCDLLVPPARFEAASQILAALGFEPELQDEDMPDWWREHGVSWYRAPDDATVDLHRTLSGLEADAQRVWEALSRDTEPIDVAGAPAQALSTPARALHVALHAAQHGGSTRQADELRRAIARTDDATWDAVAQLARELGALASLRSGLSFAPEGTALAERLGLSEQSVEVALRAAGTVDGTLTFERFLHSRGSTRLSMLRYKVFPPPTFMRKWSRLAARGPLGLTLAYLWRPLWVISKLPQTVRDWRAARRAA